MTPHRSDARVTATKAWAGALPVLAAALLAQVFGLGEMPPAADLVDALTAVATSAGSAAAVWVSIYFARNRRVLKSVAPVALLLPALALAGCGGAGTQALAQAVDRACAQFSANPALAAPLRAQAIDAVNALTVNGNYTAADCDRDGQPDIAIDANGRVLRVAP